MANRRFEMHQYRHVLVRMRLGDTTLDRLRHGAYRIILDGESYRTPRPLPEPTKKELAKGVKKGVNTAVA